MGYCECSELLYGLNACLGAPPPPWLPFTVIHFVLRMAVKDHSICLLLDSTALCGQSYYSHCAKIGIGCMCVVM